MSRPNGVIQHALLDMLKAQAAMLKVHAEAQATQEEADRAVTDLKRRMTAMEQRLEQTIAYMSQQFDELKELVRGGPGFGKR